MFACSTKLSLCVFIAPLPAELIQCKERISHGDSIRQELRHQREQWNNFALDHIDDLLVVQPVIKGRNDGGALEHIRAITDSSG
jgi:hypothetical protein